MVVAHSQGAAVVMDALGALREPVQKVVTPSEKPRAYDGAVREGFEPSVLQSSPQLRASAGDETGRRAFGLSPVIRRWPNFTTTTHGRRQS